MYDLIVIGAGHAGCEAALAAARMGVETLLLTLDLGSVALMPCNPAIGGTGKGHLVREVDALGGQMGLCIDRTFLQSQHAQPRQGSGRAQPARPGRQAPLPARTCWALCFHTPHLTVRQAEVMDILTKGGRVSGVRTMTGEVMRLPGSAWYAAACTSKAASSSASIPKTAGRRGFCGPRGCRGSLENLGFALRRFKTGTPARVDVRSIDFDRMEPQPGDDPIVPFSFLTAAGDPDTGVSFPLRNRALCYLTYTNERNAPHHPGKPAPLAPWCAAISRAPAPATAPASRTRCAALPTRTATSSFWSRRGCPATEWYVQGMSSSLPEECADGRCIARCGGWSAACSRAWPTPSNTTASTPRNCASPWKAGAVPGLYFAGQVNGTSGYEEAAAQGILAGINAACALLER